MTLFMSFGAVAGAPPEGTCAFEGSVREPGTPSAPPSGSEPSAIQGGLQVTEVPNIRGSAWLSAHGSVCKSGPTNPTYRSRRVGFRVLLRVREVVSCPKP